MLNSILVLSNQRDMVSRRLLAKVDDEVRDLMRDQAVRMETVATMYQTKLSAEKDKVAALEEKLAQKEKELTKKEKELASKEKELAEREKELGEKEKERDDDIVALLELLDNDQLRTTRKRKLEAIAQKLRAAHTK